MEICEEDFERYQRRQRRNERRQLAAAFAESSDDAAYPFSLPSFETPQFILDFLGGMAAQPQSKFRAVDLEDPGETTALSTSGKWTYGNLYLLPLLFGFYEYRASEVPCPPSRSQSPASDLKARQESIQDDFFGL